MQWNLDLNELLCKRSPRYNWTILFRPVKNRTEPRFNEILVITNTIQKRKRRIYLDITNKCQHMIERQLKMNAKQTNEDTIYV